MPDKTDGEQRGFGWQTDADNRRFIVWTENPPQVITLTGRQALDLAEAIKAKAEEFESWAEYEEQQQ